MTGPRPGVLRMPDSRFENLPGYGFQPNYREIGGLRIHYVDENTGGDEAVLLMHGEPSWSYLYRKMIPPLTSAGYRVVVPDLAGFGKSDTVTAMFESRQTLINVWRSPCCCLRVPRPLSSKDYQKK